MDYSEYPENLTSEEAAEFLGLSPKTLPNWRSHGRGPVYRKHGRKVIYNISDLRAWSDAQARHSTSGGPGNERAA